jgi:hypothetical protein
MKKSIHDIETGKITVTDMTKEEVAFIENKVSAKSAHDEAQAAAKAAVLDRLGITEAEARLLLS